MGRVEFSWAHVSSEILHNDKDIQVKLDEDRDMIHLKLPGVTVYLSLHHAEAVAREMTALLQQVASEDAGLVAGDLVGYVEEQDRQAESFED